MSTSHDRLDEIRRLIDVHARADLSTPLDGIKLSKVSAPSAGPEYSLTEPLLVVMAQGGKTLLLGDQVHTYRAGQTLVVTADLPVTGHYLDTADGPALGFGMVLRPSAIAELLLAAPPGSGTSPRSLRSSPQALATAAADDALLDAIVRMLRLLDSPADAPVLAPLITQEILWRLVTGVHGETVRQIGIADSNLTLVSRAIRWLHDNVDAPVRVDDLAKLSGMSVSAFHRHFRSVTAMSPLQFQKRLRLQKARTLLMTRPGDVAAVGHSVGYDSPSQFNREYRRLFGVPPGQDAARLRSDSFGLAALA